MNDTEGSRARVVELRASGLTLKQISAQVRLSISQVSRLAGPQEKKPRVSQRLREQAAMDYGNGMTLEQIAAKHGRSKSAISRWISSVTVADARTGPQARREAKAEEIKRLWREGLNVAAIARQVSAGHDTVRELVQGIHGGPGIFVERDAAYSIAHYQLGETIEEIADHLHRSVNTISGWLKDSGVEILSSIERRSPAEQRAYARLAGAANRQRFELAARYRVCAREDCGEEFRLRSARDRRMYHSVECAALARTDPDKRTSVTCPCGTEFETWAAKPALYHSRECWARFAPSAKRVIVEGNQFDSPWEGFFYGLCRLAHVSVQRHDRSDVVEWAPGRRYAPDFDMTWRGQRLCIEVKGRERDHDPAKWKAWREQRSLLLVLKEDELQEMRAADLKTVLDAAVR